MKKILSVLLVLCMVAILLPAAALTAEAAAPEKYVRIKVENNGAYFWYYDGVDAKGENINKYYTEGTAAIYATTTADGIVADGTADNWNLKFEWPAGGKPVLTLKGATLKGAKSRTPLSVTGNVDCTVCVETDSTITSYGTGLHLSNVGVATLTGPGKLTITTTDGSCIAFVGSASNPKGTAGLIKDANLDLYPTGASTGRCGINFYGGDLTVDNSKINITGDKDRSVGIWGYCHVTKDDSGKITKIIGYWREMSLDETERNLIIQNGSVVTAKTAVKAYGCTGSVIIKDSTVEGESKYVFGRKPVLEGEYTAVGGAKADKPVEYMVSKATTYKYFKVVPGKVDLGELGVVTQPTTEPTTAPTTEPTTAPTTEPTTAPTTEPTVEATTPATNEATEPGTDDTTKPDATEPGDTTGDEGGMSPATLAVLICTVVIVLGGGAFALLAFVIKPKWLMNLLKK